MRVDLTIEVCVCQAPFQKQSKIAYGKAQKAVDADDAVTKHDYWREIFGNAVPKAEMGVVENRTFSAGQGYIDPEEFVADHHEKQEGAYTARHP